MEDRERDEDERQKQKIEMNDHKNDCDYDDTSYEFQFFFWISYATHPSGLISSFFSPAVTVPCSLVVGAGYSHECSSILIAWTML